MKLISIRIPRTGSSTLDAYLFASFGDQPTTFYPPVRIPARYSNSELYQGDRESIQKEFEVYAPILDKSHEYVHLHLPVWVWKNTFPNVPRIVYMRDPATWVISCFFYSKSMGDIPKTMGIFEYMEIPYRSNWQSWYMDGDIKNFDFIGFQETYSDDVKGLFSFLGRELPPLPLPMPANVSVDPVYLKVRSELLKDRIFLRTVRKLFKEDYKLYKEAWSKWKKNIPLRIIS